MYDYAPNSKQKMKRLRTKSNTTQQNRTHTGFGRGYGVYQTLLQVRQDSRAQVDKVGQVHRLLPGETIQDLFLGFIILI